jgi:hypothetical protein
MKDSAVSPFILEIQSAAKLDGTGDAQRMDVWFVAYGSIDSVIDRKLMEDLAIPNKPTGDGPADVSRELTVDELNKYQLTVGQQPDNSRISYGLMGVSLFDKVRLSLVTQARTFRTPESLVLVNRIHSEITELPSTWSSIMINADDQVSLGTAQPYSLGASYAKITELKFEPGAMLVELHALFVEPQEWFNGRNMLRSKLPPLVQDGLRKFRRRLAQD